jgi:hypothetical protein
MLVNWMRWAKRNITPVFRDALIQGGGGMEKARTWLISWDELPVESITEVEVEQMGKWVAVEEYSGPWFETFSDRALLKGYRHWGDRLAVGLSDELFERAKLLNAQVHGLQHSTHRTAEVHGSMLAAWCNA